MMEKATFPVEAAVEVMKVVRPFMFLGLANGKVLQISLDPSMPGQNDLMGHKGASQLAEHTLGSHRLHPCRPRPGRRGLLSRRMAGWQCSMFARRHPDRSPRRDAGSISMVALHGEDLVTASADGQVARWVYNQATRSYSTETAMVAAVGAAIYSGTVHSGLVFLGTVDGSILVSGRVAIACSFDLCAVSRPLIRARVAARAGAQRRHAAAGAGGPEGAPQVRELAPRASGGSFVLVRRRHHQIVGPGARRSRVGPKAEDRAGARRHPLAIRAWRRYSYLRLRVPHSSAASPARRMPARRIQSTPCAPPATPRASASSWCATAGGTRCSSSFQESRSA